VCVCVYRYIHIYNGIVFCLKMNALIHSFVQKRTARGESAGGKEKVMVDEDHQSTLYMYVTRIMKHIKL
jgi:hypothetical protein